MDISRNKINIGVKGRFGQMQLSKDIAHFVSTNLDIVTLINGLDYIIGTYDSRQEKRNKRETRKWYSEELLLMMILIW